MALALPIAAPLGARFSSTFHPRYIVSFGLFLCAAGLYMLRTLDPAMGSADFIMPLALFGFGLGLGMAPLTSAATNSVPPSEVGVSSGLLNLTRNVGGAFGIAIFGTLLNGLIKSDVLTVAGNSIIRTTSQALQAQAQALIVMKAQLMAYGTVFVYASLVMFIGAVLAFFFLRAGKTEDVLSDEQKAEAMALG
jgi:hypothetical protein